MDDDILDYYERELTFIREMGAEFAKKYPKIAGRLLLEPDKCEDPHTERLIEAFAFLSARVHRKISDDFPEITESLLQILYPHYLNPVPSMSVVRFEPMRQNIAPAGYHIGRHTSLYSKPVGGQPCRFSTAYPVTMWPVQVVAAGLQDPKRLVKNAQHAIAIRMKTLGGVSASLPGLKSLRFYLNGPRQHVFPLYELVCNSVCHVECEVQTRQGKTETIALPHDAISPVGFGSEEGMLPFSSRSFPAYLLLFEYFCFPEKFLFFDLTGLDQLKGRDCSDSFTVTMYLDKAAKQGLVINEETFCLHATPVVNLFTRIAEPIRVEHRKTEYRLIPDIRRVDASEVFDIRSVTAARGSSSERSREFKPFYSLRHDVTDEENEAGGAFWYLKRMPSGRKGDNGTDVFLSFVDWDFAPAVPEVETLTVHVTCTNRDLPARLPFGDATGDFDMETAAPVARVSCLIKPTPSHRISLGGALQWRVISHLALNYLSLVQGGEDALKEILKLYDFEDSPATRQQIQGIVSLQSAYLSKRIGQSICRGVQSTVTFDEDKFVGGGVYLFACVLERFLAQYVSVNSFSQLIAKTVQRKEILKKWPPRNGNRILL